MSSTARRAIASGLWSALAVGALACSTESSGPDDVVAEIQVTAEPDRYLILGEATDFEAVARNSGGSALDVPSFTWTSSDVSVATVDDAGTVTGVGEGVAMISAAAGAVSGTVEVVVADSVATYTVTFVSTWSAATHPVDIPPNPHFSGLIGGTHTEALTVWAPGVLASTGIKDMAERGHKSPLDTEIEAAIIAGTAGTLLSGGGIALSPDSVSLTFTTGAAFPLVSLVSMVAPSPDWFVGVRSLPLLVEGRWVDSVTVELNPYDAGTDSGVSYASPDSVTVPPMQINRIQDRPFDANNVLGTFRFVRQ